MLCDDLIADEFLASQYPGWTEFQAVLARAQKFVLGADFALGADGLVENFEELARIAPYCRLPFPLTWIEFLHSDRRHWQGAPMHYPGLQGEPVRVGFLCEAKDQSLARWETYLCFSLKDAPYVGFSKNNSSMITVLFDTEKPRPELADFISEFNWAPWISIVPEDLLEDFASLSRSDWAGEIRYLIAVLGMLNAKNVAYQEKSNYTRLNKARAKNEKAPLFEHTVLKVRAQHRPSLVGSSDSNVHKEIRAHFVRGHFKTRRGGVFWWGPHMRGKYGFKFKDYKVNT